MRNMPRSTRIALAALYLRYRDARRREANLRLSLPCSSPAVISAFHTTIDASNTLLAVRAIIAEQEDGPHYPVSEFMRLASLRG